ncbi:YicC family protein [Candidatus Sulfidibacterium hydrothermale]|uniref:YicC/YloC family endoribonuclease n=1 Tax=Candidatus Sulfidibacterium hydrothermale TaxID=2875962 RepID=UPI001F0B6646|nr:YicC/YloC family endoribonuclease [Candidatus Sulfidibacterium hydrothermale]UBM61437.1 YicC family protein [Candidatus Sulfidibacterium hydrothermale]
MIRSMTGYGKATTVVQHQKIIVEIRTLNSKQLDLNMRLPQSFREKEIALRNLLREGLKRGKADFSISREQAEKEDGPVLNKPVALRYYRELKSLASEVGAGEKEDYLAIIARFPEIFAWEDILPDEKEWTQIFDAVQEAVNQVDQFRKQEGSVLEKDFRQRIASILSLLQKVDAYEEKRIGRIKERIVKNLNEHLNDVHFDKNRLEQELIYYIEKLDVTEEKVRLKKHCNYFLEVMDGEEVAGKKLGFVLQEMGREINTLGSKANDADMQKIVVLMKDELEKMKEQMLNIL